MKLLHENFEFDDDFSRFVLLDKNTQEQIAADESFEYIVRLALKYQGRGKEVIIKDTETDEIIPEEEIDQWLQDYVNSTSTDITGETDELMIKDLIEDTKTVNDAIDEFKREYGNSIDSEIEEKAIEDMSRAETYWDAKDIGSIYTNLNFYRFKDTDEIVKHAGVRTVRKGKQSVYTQGDRDYPTEHARDKDSIYFDSKLAEPYISKILEKTNLTESYASKLSRKELEDTIWEVLDQCIAYSIADTFYMDTHLDPEFDSLDDKSDEDLRWIVDELNEKGYLDQQFYEDQEAGIDWEPNKYIMREAKEHSVSSKASKPLKEHYSVKTIYNYLQRNRQDDGKLSKDDLMFMAEEIAGYIEDEEADTGERYRSLDEVDIDGLLDASGKKLHDLASIYWGFDDEEEDDEEENLTDGNFTFSKDNKVLLKVNPEIKGNVVIPDGVIKIGSSAFLGCENLKSITIPDSVTKIGMSAFERCRSLKSITIPNSVTEIDICGFYGCENLRDIYYTGTEEEFKKIDIGINNKNLFNATIHYNSNIKESFEQGSDWKTYYIIQCKNIGIWGGIVTPLKGEQNKVLYFVNEADRDNYLRKFKAARESRINNFNSYFGDEVKLSDDWIDRHADSIKIIDNLEEVKESFKSGKENIGNQIAQLLADDIGYHGSFAENEVIPNGNVLELESQGPTEIYRFNDDGSVDFVNIEEAVSGWIEEGEIDEDEGDFMIEEYAHFDSVLDLIGGGLSWFMNISDDTIEAIKKVLKVK